MSEVRVRERIKIESPYPVVQILYVEFFQQMNNHVKLHFKGVIRLDTLEELEAYIHEIKEGDTIKIFVSKDDEELFIGEVYEADLSIALSTGWLSLKCCSRTREMDFLPMERSFQNHDLEYTDLIKYIAKQHAGDAINTGAKGEVIDRPTYQYIETDWDFLKRLASLEQTVLVAEPLSDRPKVWFGLPVPKKEIDIKLYGKGSISYRKRFVPKSLHHIEHFYYEFQSRQMLHIGDEVSLHLEGGGVDKTVVIWVHGVFDKDEMFFTYRTMRDNLVKSTPYLNPLIGGVALTGNVIDVKLNHIKVHLHIDQALGRPQPVDEAHWYPVAAESNHVWYTMPHIGETVNVCIEDDNGTGFITTEVRGRTGKMATTSTMAKPTEKYMQTQWGKTMALHEGDIEFDTQLMNVLMTEEEIHFFSNDRITIDGDERIHFGRNEFEVVNSDGEIEIVIEETERIKVEAEELLTFAVTSTQAVLELDADTSAHSLLSIVHFEGANKDAMAMLASAGQQAMQEAQEAAEAEAAALAEAQEQGTQENEASGGTNTPFWRRAARVALGAVAVVAVAVVAVKLAPLVVAAVAKTAIAAKVTAGASAAVATISSTAVGGSIVAGVSTAVTAVGAVSSTILGKAVLTGLGAISTVSSGAAYFNNLWNWDEGVSENGFLGHLRETVGHGVRTATGLAITSASAKSVAQGLKRKNALPPKSVIKGNPPPKDVGLSNRGYRPKPGERTFKGFVKNNVSPEKELSLNTSSLRFNSSGPTEFKRFGVNSHAGLAPHVHQPLRNVLPSGTIKGVVGKKTKNNGVTTPGKHDVSQLYDYLINGKYR